MLGILDLWSYRPKPGLHCVYCIRLNI